jgi:hypothetical protein
LTYSGNEGAALFQYRLNDEDWSSWSEATSVTFTYLDERTYTFEVRAAYDPGDTQPTQIDPSPASVTFTVDAVGGPSLRFSPPYHEADRGTVFMLELVAEEVSDLMAVKAVLRFDPAVLTAIEVAKGSFLASTGGQQALYYTVHQYAGEIEINIGTAAGSPPGVAGSGTIAVLSFRGNIRDELDISFDAAGTGLRDSANQVITINRLVGARVKVR